MFSRSSATRAGLAALATLFAAARAEAAPEDRRMLDEFKRSIARDDVAQIERYRDANRLLLAAGDKRPPVVLFGDSITFHWTEDKLPAPPQLNLVNRGVPGQTTTQMLLRFEADVVALAPRAVVLWGGTNDLRVYEGEPAAARERVLERAIRNLTAMADIADARRIKVVFCTVTPFGTDPALQRDPATLLQLNDWIRSFARSRGYLLDDAYAALVDDHGHLPASLSQDGLHPNDDAYRRLWPLLQAALTSLKL